MKYFSKLVVACVLVVMSKVAVAMPILTPAGLNPGDTYQLAFVSSQWFHATSADIADYNARVQSYADLVWLGGGTILDGVQWSAIVSTATVDARDNAVVSGPVYNLGGELVASNYADMWDGILDKNIIFTQRGFEINQAVFTGSTAQGTAQFPGMLGPPSPEAVIGLSSARTSNWISYSVSRNDSRHSIYGLSEVLVVPPAGQVPEPATLALFGLGLAGLRVSRRKRQTKR